MAEHIIDKIIVDNSMPEVKKISMLLDDYDDIFSDFDPRPYSERALSDDFLSESQKMFREKKTGRFELRLLIPKAIRNEKDESLIKRRLKSFFKLKEQDERMKIQKAIRTGIILSIIGFMLMLIAAFLYSFESERIISKFLVVLFEPAGWFSVWYGLDKIFYTASEKKKSHSFFKRISEADIIFGEY